MKLLISQWRLILKALMYYADNHATINIVERVAVEVVINRIKQALGE